MKPDFGCHANTLLSPANFTLEMLNSYDDGMSNLKSYNEVLVVAKPDWRAGS